MANSPERYFSAERAAEEPVRTSGKAVASLVLGLGSLTCSVLTAIPALVFGLLGLREIDRSQGRLGGRSAAIMGLALAVVVPLVQLVLLVLFGMLLPALQIGREGARRTVTLSQLKNIAIAAHTYHDNRQEFPATAGDATGAPVSWRFKILPFLEPNHWYEKYDQAQPWDSAKNSAISQRPLPFYHDTNDPDTASNRTYFLAVVGPGTALTRDRPLKFEALPSLAQTILFVEANADRAVPWAEPKDLDYNPADPMAGLGGVRPGMFLAAFADATAKSISNDIDPDVLRALMSRDDGDNVKSIDGP